jgi:hypothetical protein
MDPIDNRPSAEKWRQQTKTPFMNARVPLRDRPWVLNAVHSSFETSSRKPSCSGEYWAMRAMKSARISSLRSDVAFLIFLAEIPAWRSSRSKVSSYKTVSLKQVLKLVKEPVWTVLDKTLEIFNIREMKVARAATNTICILENPSRSIPECENTIKSSRWDTQIVKNSQFWEYIILI